MPSALHHRDDLARSAPAQVRRTRRGRSRCRSPGRRCRAPASLPGTSRSTRAAPRPGGARHCARASTSSCAYSMRSAAAVTKQRRPRRSRRRSRRSARCARSGSLQPIGRPVIAITGTPGRAQRRAQRRRPALDRRRRSVSVSSMSVSTPRAARAADRQCRQRGDGRRNAVMTRRVRIVPKQGAPALALQFGRFPRSVARRRLQVACPRLGNLLHCRAHPHASTSWVSSNLTFDGPRAGSS